jgi:CubicO group peptidase (beta-lactamase class C family)
VKTIEPQQGLKKQPASVFVLKGEGYTHMNSIKTGRRPWIEKSTTAYSVINEEMGLGYGYLWNVVKPGAGFSNMLFDGKGAFYHTGVGIHTLSVLPELRLIYIYRYDTDGEFKDPGDATIQLVSMILNARLPK